MSLLTREMTVVAIEGAGGPECLVPAVRPVPLPETGEVLIKVEAAGVNRPDVMQRKGLYPPPPGASDIPGLEVAGKIVAIGAEVEAELIGQRVCALVTGGGYAEYCLAHAAHCLPVPAALSMVEAAAMPETLFTVWSNLFERAYVVEGERVLVHGGTSGIGTMAIALGRLFGLEILVTCGTDDKCRAALSLGAHHAINYNSQDFVEEVRLITGGEGVHVVLDMVAGDYVQRNLKCLSFDGRHVTIAVQGGVRATVSMVDLMIRRVTMTGSTLRPRDTRFKALVADEIHRNVWHHVERGELRPVVDRAFPLAEAAAAHAHMEAGHHVGKIVLTID